MDPIEEEHEDRYACIVLAEEGMNEEGLALMAEAAQEAEAALAGMQAGRRALKEAGPDSIKASWDHEEFARQPTPS